jgi:hypothetical protein
MTGPNAIQRIADAVGAPIGTSRRIVHGAETPMGVVWRRDDGHEFAVWRDPFETISIALEVSHYDSQDELKACDRYTVGELLPGDKVRTVDDVVGEVVASITRDLVRVP